MPLFPSHPLSLGLAELSFRWTWPFIFFLEVWGSVSCWCPSCSRRGRRPFSSLSLCMQILPDEHGSAGCLAVSLRGLTKVIAIIDVPLLIINVNESTKQ